MGQYFTSGLSPPSPVEDFFKFVFKFFSLPFSLVLPLGVEGVETIDWLSMLALRSELELPIYPDKVFFSELCFRLNNLVALTKLLAEGAEVSVERKYEL